MDSTKILTEKLLLARELATIRPELEHLRSQAAYQQTVLSEKLALQRQVSTLEVELETEKRASKRAMEKSKKEKELDLQQQVDDLQKELSEEKRERAKDRQAAEDEWNADRKRLQEQLEDLQGKLAKEKKGKGKVKELEAEKRAIKHTLDREISEEQSMESQQRLEDLKAEFAEERRAWEKAKKVAAKEWESEKRTLTRSAEKANSRDKLAELQQLVGKLENDLTTEKNEAAEARKSMEKDLGVGKRAMKRATETENSQAKLQELQQQVEDLKAELALEKRQGEKARKSAEKGTEAAKRASKQLSDKNGSSEEYDQELRGQLDQIRMTLAQEIKEKDKARKEAEREMKASEAQKTVLESKLDQIRTKLQSTKEELKEAQNELSQARLATVKVPKSSKGEVPSKNPRKRSAVEMSNDLTIGTPDGVADRRKRAPIKKGRMDQTLVGEKSMFSITPFLNRTTNMALDSPTQEEDEEHTERASLLVEQQFIERQAEPIMANDNSPTVAPKAKTKKRTAEMKALREVKSGNTAKKPPPKKGQISRLEQVTEEDGDENEAPNQVQIDSKVDGANPKVLKTTGIAEETEPKKKKRKLVGGAKTLFDEDDGETTKRPAKITLGPARLLGKGGLAGPKGGLKGGLGSASAFGAFSPLKKDRRGVGASFLG